MEKPFRENKSESGAMDTQDRLLQAAGEVFAQRGFRAATVREISQRAGANVAAINYYFGDKKALYSAVLKFTLMSAREKYPPNYGLTENPTAEERLHAFVLSLLYRILDEGRPAWHGRLMVREMADPTPGLDPLIESSVKPMYELLNSIVKEIMGNRADQESAILCSMSIIGQCLFYRHGRTIISALYPDRYGIDEVDVLATHITRFAVSGIQSFSPEALGRNDA